MTDAFPGGIKYTWYYTYQNVRKMIIYIYGCSER